MTQIVELLGTQGCHLCEVAERMVRRLAPECGVQIRYVDIADNDVMVDEYGMRIPVLRAGSGIAANISEKVSEKVAINELGWPFEEEEFIVWAKQLA